MEGTPIIIKKKKAHGHAHHGGSWKVAYADFVTAMMAFFMVMWILGLSDEAKAQISGYFNDPMGYSKTTPLTRNIVKFPGTPVSGGAIKAQVKIVREKRVAITYLYKRLRETLAAAAARGVKGPDGKTIDVKGLADHLEVVQTKEGLRIEFKEGEGSVFFESGSSEIRPEALALIKRLAPLLASSDMPMKIEGHTDAVPYSQTGYNNWDLSAARASSLRRALESSVKSSQFLSVSGFADTRLRDPEHPTSPVNRRVSVLLPIADSGGDVDEGVQEALSQNPDIVPEIDLRKKKPVGNRRVDTGINAFGFRKQ